MHLSTRTRWTLLVFAAALLLTLLPMAASGQSPSQPKSPAPPTRVPESDPLIARANKAADYSAKLAGRAVLIMVDGQIRFERYDNNWTPALPHPLASGTKSFSGVAAARAIQDGLISSWDELAADTLTEWKADPQKSRITLRHLLSLSSGLTPGETEVGSGFAQGPADKAAASLALPMQHEPGSRFEYGPSHYYAFGELLRRKLVAANAKDPKKFPVTDVLGYMHAKIFDPIGLKVGRFGKDSAGNPNLPGGCMLTAREWAKFGELIRLNGSLVNADGTTRQLIDPALLAECFKPTPTNRNYGLTFWLLNGPDNAPAPEPDNSTLRQKILRRALELEVGEAVIGPDGKPLQIIMAAGKGKQRLYIIPQYKMVIVRFAKDGAEGRAFSNSEFLKPILNLEDPAPPRTAPPLPAR